MLNIIKVSNKGSKVSNKSSRIAYIVSLPTPLSPLKTQKTNGFPMFSREDKNGMYDVLVFLL